MHCALGCNTIPGERYGTLRRVRNRYNGEVNGYFLCDRGRYGYEFVNGPPSPPVLARCPKTRSSAPCSAAVGRRQDGPSESVHPAPPLRPTMPCGTSWARKTSIIGVPDARLERERLMLKVLREGPAPSASPHEAALSDAVLVLGEDAWNTAPILALNLRQAAANAPAAAAIKQKKLNSWDDAAVREAIRDEKGPLFVASVESTELDAVARESFRGAPAEIARLGFAVAHEIDPAAPAVEGLEPAAAQAAQRIAAALKAAERPLVVSGGGLGSAEVIQAAAERGTGALQGRPLGHDQPCVPRGEQLRYDDDSGRWNRVRRAALRLLAGRRAAGRGERPVPQH